MNLLFSKPNYNDLLDNYKKKINRSRFLYSYKEKSLEKYLLNNSIIDLPSCFLENFEKIMHKVSEIGLRPHIITSDGRYEFNLYFKFWVALKISQGKNLYLLTMALVTYLILITCITRSVHIIH